MPSSTHIRHRLFACPVGRYAAFVSSGLVSGFGDGVFIRSVERPNIDSIVPNTAAPGNTTSVVLHGSGYLVGPAPVVEFGAGVHVDSATVVSETEVDVTITVDAGATAGPRTVTFASTGTGPGPGARSPATCGNCFTVSP